MSMVLKVLHKFYIFFLEEDFTYKDFCILS